MLCPMRANDIALTCTTTYQKWTGQSHLATDSKNPLPSGMGSVKSIIMIEFYFKKGLSHAIIQNKNT